MHNQVILISFQISHFTSTTIYATCLRWKWLSFSMLASSSFAPPTCPLHRRAVWALDADPTDPFEGWHELGLACGMPNLVGVTPRLSLTGTPLQL